jgi:hypothetical protein
VPLDEMILRILFYIDPWLFTGFLLILLGGIYWPEIVSVGKWLRRKMHVSAAARTPFDQFAERAERIKNVIGFPGVLTPTVVRVDRKQAPSASDELEILKERVDCIEAAVQVVHRLSLSLNKAVLTPDDLAIYLGTNKAGANEFVRRNNIRKIHVSERKGSWCVLRSDIESIFGGVLDFTTDE